MNTLPSNREFALFRHRRAVRLRGIACALATWVGVSVVPANGALKVETPFRLARDDVVVFTGGTDTVVAQEHGILETLLTLATTNLHVRFRNLGWEGDTVYEQRRDLNFGPWSAQFKKVGATVIFAQFGQAEALQGKTSLPRFAAAYEKLLDDFAQQTRRIVLVTPHPFEKGTPPLPDLSARNDGLRHFVEAIREIAAKQKYAFVDLFDPLQHRAEDPPLTSNGVHLTESGHWIVAREIARQLGFDPATKAVRFDSATGMFSPAPMEALRQSILVKNRLWFDYWRPMNWAFLHGDRTEQPSSRDHRDPKTRWFPAELEKFGPLIEGAEARIGEAADKIRRQ